MKDLKKRNLTTRVISLPNNSFNSKKEIIANISHDLNTPLTIIQGYTETLKMKMRYAPVEEKEKYLKIILENTKKLSTLVGQLSKYSKMDTYHMKLSKKPFSMIDLMEQTKQEYNILTAKKNIQLTNEYAKNTSLVLADVFLIKRVIQNLLDNAITYTPNNGKIIIRVSNLNKQIMVEVIDSGPGISKDEQVLIFDRYQKNKNSLGGGLGLSIVKRILELHQSTIQVKSQPGKGSCFNFTLPVYHINCFGHSKQKIEVG